MISLALYSVGQHCELGSALFYLQSVSVELGGSVSETGWLLAGVMGVTGPCVSHASAAQPGHMDRVEAGFQE